jgi:hypothetical protein
LRKNPKWPNLKDWQWFLGWREFSSFCEKRFRKQNILLRIIRKTPKNISIKQLSKTRHLSNITKIEKNKNKKQKDKSLRTSRDKELKHAWKKTSSNEDKLQIFFPNG